MKMGSRTTPQCRKCRGQIQLLPSQQSVEAPAKTIECRDEGRTLGES